MSEWGHNRRVHELLERLNEFETDPERKKYCREVAQEAWTRMANAKGKPPTPIVYGVNGSYVTAGYESKLRTFLMPSGVDSEGFGYALEIFELDIVVHHVKVARDFVGDCKQPANTLRNRLRACAKVLEDNNCREVGALFRRISISDEGLITFHKDRHVILPAW